MRREAVPQGMERYAFGELGHVSCGMASAVELTRAERVHPVLSGKQPALWPRCLVPGAQQFEQMWRQHHVAIFADFASFDANDDAFAVDVADLEFLAGSN
jgi:hypothetical protein